MIGRAWGNLTPFGRSLALLASVAVMAVALLFGLLLGEYASAAPAPVAERPMVLASSMVAVTTPVIDLGRTASMDAGEVDGRGPVGTLSASQLRAIALGVSGSPIWAQWAVECWAGESGQAGRYRVAAVSPVNADGSRDYGIAQVNDRAWAPYGFDPERATSDPVYAVEFAWSEIMPRQGVGAWFAPGCGS